MAQTYEYWVGVDVAGATRNEIHEFNDFYDNIHVKEILRNNAGFLVAHRYELLDPPPGKGLPQWLAIYQVADEESMNKYIAAEQAGTRLPRLSAGPPTWQDRSRRTTPWRLLWDPIFESPEQSGVTAGIYMVGMNAPLADTAERVGQFNEFYNEVHGPEILRHKPSRRLRRYRLRASLHNAAGNSPDFLAQYEISQRQVDALLNGTAKPRDPNTRFSSGPEVWETHQTLWRASYRLLSSTTRENDDSRQSSPPLGSEQARPRLADR